MANLKQIIVKGVVISACLGGGLSPVLAQAAPSDAGLSEPTLERTLQDQKTAFDKKRNQVKAKLNKVERWTNRKMDKVEAVYNAGERKFSKVQDKARPYGQAVRSKVKSIDVPGMEAAAWPTKHMSMPALLLILLFGASLLVLGGSQSRTYDG